MHIQDNDTQRNLSTVSERSEMKQNLDILSVKIRPTVSPVGEWKNKEKKLNIRTF